MKSNMAILDRIIRVVLVALVAVLYFTHQLGPVAAIILGILAVVFLLTSIIGMCPIYMLLGISTKRKPAH
jgi:Inner membrane protein YgaP-like, transmembrane domain